MKILLIEDLRTERTIIKRWLEQEGYDVIEASDGNEGILLYKTHEPDLVITDLVMPDKEGIETIIELQKDYPSVKIFAISGAGLKSAGDYLPLAEKIGALRSFIKPIDKFELMDAVQEVFT